MDIFMYLKRMQQNVYMNKIIIRVIYDKTVKTFREKIIWGIFGNNAVPLTDIVV